MNGETKTIEQETIERAKAEFLRVKEMMIQALAATPDDRINWLPAPTARTPIQQVAHAAAAVKNVHEILNSRPFQITNTAEADKSFREWEKQFTTRESVLQMFEENCAEYSAWLDALTPEALNATVELPFGSGFAPVSAALSFAPNHTTWHTAQIHYMQTIYGDLDWH